MAPEQFEAFARELSFISRMIVCTLYGILESRIRAFMERARSSVQCARDLLIDHDERLAATDNRAIDIT